jgi:hypothetical protein
MNSSVLNYHLATVRTADIERESRRIRARESDAEPRRERRGVAGERGRRAALVARLIG